MTMRRTKIVCTLGPASNTRETVAAMPYDQVNPYTETRWQVTNPGSGPGKGDIYWSGFVDLQGKEVVPLIYTEIGMWQPEVERSRAVINEKVGFLDELGNVAIPIQYEYAEIFDKGKARVMLNSRQFFIDPMGKELLLVKSTNHFHAGFKPIAAEIIYVVAPSFYPSDPRVTDYRKLNRAIWPRVENPFG